MSNKYSARLSNQDLQPAKKTWSWYNIFSFWMSDVHSIGGYVVAASLFTLGLTSWQVLLALVVGICIVQVCANLIAKPSQISGVPYAVISRQAFGVYGANIPALIRGVIAVSWYGIQTWLASNALMLILLKFFPTLSAFTHTTFLNLSLLGWACFSFIWVVQAVIFWKGMETIKKFIDWAGPMIYVVMLALVAWIINKAGWHNINFDLSEKDAVHGSAVGQFVIAVALVVSYFSGPLLNFGDFSRYTKNMSAVRKGNLWGLPVNFIFFSLITVILVSGTFSITGKMITDPLATVALVDSTTAVVLGVITVLLATVGINIVANFVSAGFDFSNVSQSKISFRTGGMIAAVGSVVITPWNLFNSPEIIHYTLDVLAAFIGPLFGILIADFYFIKKQNVDVDALFSESKQGAYWYKNGINPHAVVALLLSVIVGLVITLTPALSAFAPFTWFIGVILGGTIYRTIARKTEVRTVVMKETAVHK